MHTTIFAQATNEFQKSQKCDIFFKKMPKKSTLVKFSSV